MFDIVYAPRVPGCISNSKGDQLCSLRGDYYQWQGGLAHRIVWEAFHGPIPSGMFVDHINRDKLDNRIENLRLATRSQNSHNCHRPKKDGLPKGINKLAKGYQATIHVNGVKYTKKVETLDEAVSWRAAKGRGLLGEYYLA